MACSFVVIVDRTITYSASSFQITMQYRRSSEVIGRCRATIMSSGSSELVTPSAMRLKSTLSNLGQRRSPVRTPATQRAAMSTANSTISTSFGRTSGTAAFTPTISGVSRISRYAATCGLARTQPLRPTGAAR